MGGPPAFNFNHWLIGRIVLTSKLKSPAVATKHNADSHFVNDGYSRAYQAVGEQVSAEVKQQFAERLQQASFFERFRIRHEMAQEIERRIHATAPPDALY